MEQGCIKTFLDDKGFGFIRPSGGGEDVFFHKSVVRDRGYPPVEGAPVEFETGPGRKPGEIRATRVVITGRAGEGEPGHSPGKLPDECIFSSFYGPDGRLDRKIYFEAPPAAATCFQKAGLKSSQLRQLYQAFQSFAGPLQENRLDFPQARERFGAFYVERVVRQVNREYLPLAVKALFDEHRGIVLADEREMLGLFEYLKNILCYFGDKDKS